jgi:hypothetical protein
MNRATRRLVNHSRLHRKRKREFWLLLQQMSEIVTLQAYVDAHVKGITGVNASRMGMDVQSATAREINRSRELRKHENCHG